jgi:hypothetical protein
LGKKSLIEWFAMLKLSVDGLAVPAAQAAHRTKYATSSLKVGIDIDIKPVLNSLNEVGPLASPAIVQVNAGWNSSAGANCTPNAEFSATLTSTALPS